MFDDKRKDRTRTSTRKALRNNATFAEKILWRSLRGSKLDGRKFTRQKGIGIYVVDFYCPEERLVIELDGSVHDLPEVQEYDAVREAYLRDCGLTVLRFTNYQAVEGSDEVLATIRAVWKGRERESILVKSSRTRQPPRPPEGTPPPDPLL